ncbi:MAG TPA: ABC transporter ATP-binding protein [Chthonomonadaceae bacterium]|nr:ABC transporter ATP-binding protein [Chthonomonadaceae bacterium]
MSDEVVCVENVSKKFCRSLKRGMLYTAADVTRDLLGLPSAAQRLRPEEFWAVRDASFTVRRGECLGIVGGNGAGKSTLLKMLNGIIRPDVGCIRLRGRMGALIEVGAGFHPMLSGQENIYVNGAILGMSRREIDRKFDAIVEFAGLEPGVLQAPVKTYSSGMYVRLGFAIAAHSEPEILLIDEVLSVGDLAFVNKCRQHIADLLERGTAVVFVTHHLHQAEAICRRAILLEAGGIVTEGSARKVVDAYRRRATERRNTPTEAAGPIGPAPRLGQIRLTDGAGTPVETLIPGQMCALSIELLEAPPDFRGELRISLWREDGSVVTAAAAVPWEQVRAALHRNRFLCTFPVAAMPGPYQLGIYVAGMGRYEYYDQAVSQPFCVVADAARAPYIPRHDYAYTVLELRPGAELLMQSIRESEPFQNEYTDEISGDDAPLAASA